MKTEKKKTRLENLIDLAVESYGEQAVFDAVEKSFGKAALLEFTSKLNLNLIIEKVTDEHGFDEVCDNLVGEFDSGMDRMVSYLTERGYNVIKTTSLKEQMELEEVLARLYPKINMRENLFLTI